MARHLSFEQVEEWLDEKVVEDVERTSGDQTDYNIQLRLSRLPIHVVKETKWGPLRVVGKSSFDTARVANLVENNAQRQELLTHIGPVLAATPGFYTFLDKEDNTCEFAEVHSIQIEHRIYPDEATQQALMDALIDVATTMRYIQNIVASLRDGRGEENQ